MFFNLHGRKTARIKKFTEVQEHCRNCKSFDLDIKVYRDYHHFMFIPIIPVGDKVAKIYCNHCGDGLRIETIRKQYEASARTPFYLYSAPILFSLFISLVVIAGIYKEKETARYVADPKVGDIYCLYEFRNTAPTYYYARVMQVNGDSVYAYLGNLAYLGSVDRFDDSDFFRKDEFLSFSKLELRKMLDTAGIHSVERGYGDEKGFNRIR